MRVSGRGGEVGLEELIEGVTHPWERVREETVPLCSKQRAKLMFIQNGS